MRYVKSVVQVVGHSKIPWIPQRSEDLRAWYYKVCWRISRQLLDTDAAQHSLVVVPSNHRALLEETKITRGHGKILKFGAPHSFATVDFELLF